MRLLINEKDNLKDCSKKYAIRNIIPDVTLFLKMTKPYLILSTFNRRNVVIVKNLKKKNHSKKS